MRRARRWYKTALLAALVAGGSLLVDTASAAGKPVRVEVSVAPGQGPDDVKQAFARLVEREVKRLSLGAGRSGATYVLSATLVKLESETQGTSTTASCRVTAALRERQSGALRAILRGGARARDGKARADQTRTAAMEAAVRSTLSKLQSALPNDG